MSEINLNTCKHCGCPLTIVDGTDPGEESGDFEEVYECPNGHRGTYRHYGNPRVEDTATGACKA